MSDPLRITAPVVELTDVLEVMPPNGSKVFALGAGGVLAPVSWGNDSAKFFVAWMPYPKVPLSVKARLSPPPVNEVNPKDEP
jgi:hypothetical protein